MSEYNKDNEDPGNGLWQQGTNLGQKSRKCLRGLWWLLTLSSRLQTSALPHDVHMPSCQLTCLAPWESYHWTRQTVRSRWHSSVKTGQLKDSPCYVVRLGKTAIHDTGNARFPPFFPTVLPFLVVCHDMIALPGTNEERCNLSQPTQSSSPFSFFFSLWNLRWKCPTLGPLQTSAGS